MVDLDLHYERNVSVGAGLIIPISTSVRERRKKEIITYKYKLTSSMVVCLVDGCAAQLLLNIFPRRCGNLTMIHEGPDESMKSKAIRACQAK